MKYFSIDLETLGLFLRGGRGPDKMLQFAAVFEDSDNPLPIEECPSFNVIVSQDTYTGEPYALWLNGWILKEIDQHQKNQWMRPEKVVPTKYPVMTVTELVQAFKEWARALQPKGRLILAGKNVAQFDFQFFPQGIADLFHHRMIDPGNLFLDMSKESPPSITDLCDRFELGAVTHDALGDARQVVQLVRIWQGYGNTIV